MAIDWNPIDVDKFITHLLLRIDGLTDELQQEREANATLRRELTAALSDLAHSTYACPHCQMAILQCGECERKVRMQG